MLPGRAGPGRGPGVGALRRGPGTGAFLAAEDPDTPAAGLSVPGLATSWGCGPGRSRSAEADVPVGWSSTVLLGASDLGEAPAGPGLGAGLGEAPAGPGLGAGLGEAPAGPGLGAGLGEAPAGPGLGAGLGEAPAGPGLGPGCGAAPAPREALPPRGAGVGWSVCVAKCSRTRRATGGSTVEEAALTNSPWSLSQARITLEVTLLPVGSSSLASSCTRGLATFLLSGYPPRTGVGASRGSSSPGTHRVPISFLPAFAVGRPAARRDSRIRTE